MTTDPDLTPVEDGEMSSRMAEEAQASDASVMVETPPETPFEAPAHEAEASPEAPAAEPPATETNVAETPIDSTADGEFAPVVEPVTAPADEPPTPLEDEPLATVEAEAPPVEEISAPEAPVEPETTAELEALPVPEANDEAAAETEAHAEPEPGAATASAPEPKLSDAQLFEQAMSALEGGDEEASEGGFKKLSKGDRVEATVIQVDRDRVFVDLGTKSEGIVPLTELTDLNIDHADQHVKVGDKIQVVVLRPEGAEGNPIVSKKRADFEEAWDKIESSFTEGKTINALVVDRVKGGLVVDIGVRGFVPATHVGSGKLRNIEKYVGQNIPLKIIEIDRERKKVVLSNRQAEEERRVSAKENIFQNVTPGDVLEGTVRRLVDYGAFIDLGGVDGLLHISEMSWMRIAHPKEMFREGQKIKVMVLRLDQGAGKISLGHRQVLPDPWNLIRDNYTVGQKLNCTIGRIVQTGAFVKLPEGAEAFLPLSEMSMRRIRRPEEAVTEGQELEVQIIDLRPDDRRMVLSMRAAGSADRGAPMHSAAPSYDDDRDFKRGGGGLAAGKKGKKTKGGRGGRGGREEDDFEEVGGGRRGFATGGATIGERLGMLKGFALREDEADEELEEAAAEETTEATAESAPAAKAEGAAVEEAKAEEAKAEEAKAEVAMPEESKPEESKPEETEPVSEEKV